MTAPMVIYLETNWLVSCVLPHHPWQSEALELLAEAEAGKCQLRIPTVAFLEARHVVERETQANGKVIATAAASLRYAGRNASRPDLRDLAQQLLRAEATYRLPNPGKSLAELTKRCAPYELSHVKEEQDVLDQLRGQVAMRGGDITDLHILAAVAADRTLNPSGRAAFLSTSSRDFAVHGSSAKLPRDFYSSRRLVYLDKFQLASAERLWAKADADGWPPPTAPQTDKRLQEAQRILYALAEDQRDQALAALRALLP